MSETTNLKLFKHDNPSTNTNQFNIEKSLNENWDKVDVFAGDINGKALKIKEGLEEENKKIKESITDIQKEQEVQNDSINTNAENIEINKIKIQESQEENKRLKNDIEALGITRTS